MDEVLVGLFLLTLGAVVCFVGLRIFLIALPIWGFISGFYVGAAGIEAVLGDGFLATGTSWVIGALVGLVFMALSYIFWYIGVVIAAGSVGALIGSGIMSAFGVDSGWIVFIVAATAAVIAAIVALFLALPVYVVIVNTALVGAAAIVTGAMLLFNQLEVGDLGYGTAWAMIDESWFWAIAWVALAVAGTLAQSRRLADTILPDDRWAVSSPSNPSIAR